MERQSGERRGLLTWLDHSYASTHQADGGGRPKQERKPSVLRSVCSFILVTEFCERLSFYGIVGILPVLFTTKFGLSNVHTTEFTSLFSSLTYLTPLLGAYVADAKLGRFRTIQAFCLVYIVGLAMCATAVLPSLIESFRPLFYVGLFVFVALGAGGIKPNVVVFGADQFGEGTDQNQAKESFFRWFYWSVNFGSTFSYLYLSNLAVNDTEHSRPLSGFAIVLLIVVCAFVIGTVAFSLGSPRYKKLEPSGSVLARSWEIFLASGRTTRTGMLVVGSVVMLAPAVMLTIGSYFAPHGIHTILSGTGMGLTVTSVVCLVLFARSNNWLMTARQSLGGKYLPNEVMDLSGVVRLLPYFGFMILFWAIYGQMSTNFIIQGCQMDVRVNDNYQLNATSLSAFNSLAILFVIPLYEKLLLPVYMRVLHRPRPTPLQQIGVGFVFAACAMAAAAVVEVERKKHDEGFVYSLHTMPAQDLKVTFSGKGEARCNADCCNPQHLNGTAEITCTDAMVRYGCHCAQVDGVSLLAGCTGQPLTHLSVWFQAVPYCLVAVSEVFASTSSYELFYSEVPDTMRSVCQALNLLTTCLGLTIAGGLNSLFSFWITDNLNHGHLESMFVLLASLMTANFLLFVVVSRSFKYRSRGSTSSQARFPSTPRAPGEPGDEAGDTPGGEAVAVPAARKDSAGSAPFVTGLTPEINHHPSRTYPSAVKL